MFTIKQLAKEFNTTPRTLRYYEELNIIKPTREGSQRIYSKVDKQRLEFTLQAKELGIALSDMAEIFELYDESQKEETQLFRFIQLLRAKQRELEQKQTNLEIMKKQIDEYEQQCLQHIKDKGLIS